MSIISWHLNLVGVKLPKKLKYIHMPSKFYLHCYGKHQTTFKFNSLTPGDLYIYIYTSLKRVIIRSGNDMVLK